VRIEVPGIPAPQGSKRHVGNGIMVEASAALRPWRDAVTWHARRAHGPRPPMGGAVQVTMLFVFPRPRSHYGTGRNAGTLKPGAPVFHTSKPDIDKLIRAILDALTQAGAVKDDCIIAAAGAKKIYGARPGCRITVESLEGELWHWDGTG
jgi:crossover junction endodeoxyribonuclease RusA